MPWLMTGWSCTSREVRSSRVLLIYTVNRNLLLAHKLVDSSTTYFYDPRTQTYLQPTASNQILQRFLSVNRKLVDQLTLSKDVVFEKREGVSAGQPLKSLFPIATTEQHMAPMILSVVLEELGKQEKFVAYDPMPWHFI